MTTTLSRTRMLASNESSWKSGTQDLETLRSSAFCVLACATEEDADCLAGAERNLAYYLLWTGKYNESIQRANRAIQWFDQVGDIRGQAESHDIVSMSQMFLGALGAAIESALEALNLFQKIGCQRGCAWGYHNLGHIYEKLEEYENAEQYYLQSVSVFKEIAYDFGLSRAAAGLGELYKCLGNYEGALRFLSMSMKHTDQANSMAVWTKTSLLAGLVQLEMGKDEQAKKTLEDCLQNCGEEENLEVACRASLALGELAAKQSLEEKALNYLFSALDAAERACSDRFQAESHLRISSYFAQKGRFQKALEHHQKYAQRAIKEKRIQESQLVASLQSAEEQRVEANQMRKLAEQRRKEFEHANFELQQQI
ncbi:MAG: tetratricopeptide repeat protein, partial [Myxococcota bacterium]